MRRVEFLSKDKKLVGVFHPMKGEEKESPCVITCHGLDSYKDSEKYIEIAKRFSNDFSVFRFDFRGCGESEGDKIRDLSNRIEDLRAAINLIKNQPSVDANIGLFGSSMGGYLSILIAAEEEIKAIVTWSAPYRLGYLKSDARDVIQDIRCPIMIIHGDKDELVPISHARELYDCADEPKELKIIDGADHRFMDLSLRDKAIDISLEWFKRYL
ncbi:MAG: Alpha/beta hydrolase family protein [Candidatus Methanolliviera sp. GoM_asphalt]|nr:MAG: Alpha/beta hydrolase family protein [Candidatus Methanolliviera sp. GoM_asphalt]